MIEGCCIYVFFIVMCFEKCLVVDSISMKRRKWVLGNGGVFYFGENFIVFWGERLGCDVEREVVWIEWILIFFVIVSFVVFFIVNFW